MKRVLVAGVCIGLGLAMAAGARAELPRHRAKPKPLPGIPGYDYRPNQVTPAATVTAVSLPKLDATPAPLPGQPPRIATQVYQLVEPRLQIDHCFISRVAVAVHEDGWYQISLRADQNPQQVDDIRSPLRPGERLDTTLQTTQLKRNQFVVKVRGFAAAPINQNRNLPLATPTVVEFPPIEFVVQRGEPASKTVNAYLPEVKKYFPLIDRVEVEFTYR